MTHYVIVRHLVSYYPHWEEVYKKHVQFALSYELEPVHVLRGVEKSNDVVVIAKAQDLDKAKQFMESNFLKEAMKKAGVMEKPEITYHTEA